MENQGGTSPHQLEESIKYSLDQAGSFLNHCRQSVNEVCSTWNKIGDEIRIPQNLKLDVEEFVQIQQSDRKKAIRLTLTDEQNDASQGYNEMKTEFNHLMLLSVSVNRNQLKLLDYLINSMSSLREFNAAYKAAVKELKKLRNTCKCELMKLDAISKKKDDEIAKLRLDLKNANAHDCSQNSDLKLNTS